MNSNQSVFCDCVGPAGGRKIQSMFPRIKSCLEAALISTAILASPVSAQFIYVANAGDDTVSKIDINLNQEVARYSTWFNSGSNNLIASHSSSAWMGPAPSRVARDSMGNAYVLDRFFSNAVNNSTNPPHLPVLLKIASYGGTPTSNGSTPLAIADISNDNDIGSGEAADVRILWAKPVGRPATTAPPDPGDTAGVGRAVCIDTTGIVWVGMFYTQRYFKVDPNTGQMLPPLTGIPMPAGSNHRPYGCQVDRNGTLWSIDENDTGDNELAEIDTATGQVKTYKIGAPHVFYALSLFNACGSGKQKIYLSDRSITGAKTYRVFDPSNHSFSNSPLPATAQFTSLAIGVDHQGNIVSGELGTGRVIKSDPSGTVLWDTGSPPLGNSALATTDLHGIIIDDNDNVWAVDRPGGRVIKYNGGNVLYPPFTIVKVGNQPYTYGNAPPPSCPCAEIGEHPITCEKPGAGSATYSWSFTFTNHSPFSAPATGIDISSSQASNITPSHVQLANPVPVNGQGTVSGTFTVANPIPGSQVCLDIRLKAEDGWCCPLEHVCFLLPECSTCAKLEGQFKCQQGKHILNLSITNQGPAAADGVQVFSNTPGVSVGPQMTMQTFPQGTPVTIPLTLTGASPGQIVSLTVNLHGPIDPKTGVYSWCCTATLEIGYPKKLCLVILDGSTFEDLDRNGIRGSEEKGLSGWTVTLADGKSAPRTTTTDQGGTYHFEDVDQGTYRLAVQPPASWVATSPKTGVYQVTVAGLPERQFEFGFTKTGQDDSNRRSPRRRP